MKAMLKVVVLTLSAMSLSAFAQHHGQPMTGGFSGPVTGGLNTVKQVLDAGMFSDDTPVTLTGHITGSMGGEMYSFSDGTGTIPVDIDGDKWFGLQATPQTKVVIQGDIDKDFNQVKIDVDFIRPAQ